MPKSGKLRQFSPLLCFYFIVFTDSIYLLFGGFDNGQLSEKSGDSLAYQALILITYLVMLIKLASGWPVASRTLLKSLGVILFIGSATLSYVAVGAENIVILRFVLYVLTITAALDISSRYNIDEVCETFFYTSIIIFIGYCLAYPLLRGLIKYDELARDNLFGLPSYAGLFPHKNAAAEVFSLVFIVSLARFSGSRDTGRRGASLSMMCGSLLVIVMAGAIGPLFALMLGLAASILFRALVRGDLTFGVPFACILMVPVVLLFTFGVDGILGFFGRSSNFTGRETLAHFWPSFFWQRPILGYGFGGFFTGLPGAPGTEFSHLLSKASLYATFESAYLDALIQFGLVGGILLACILIKAIFKSAQFYRFSASLYKAVPLNILAYVLVASISGASVLLQNYVVCIFVFWIYFGVKRLETFRASNRVKTAVIEPAV